jgi:hypothetical protein
MTNHDRIPLLPRLLLAVARAGLDPSAAAVLEPLGTALARELPVRALPLALVRLRRHLRSADDGAPAGRRRPQSAGASSSTGCRR